MSEQGASVACGGRRSSDPGRRRKKQADPVAEAECAGSLQPQLISSTLCAYRPLDTFVAAHGGKDVVAGSDVGPGLAARGSTPRPLELSSRFRDRPASKRRLAVI